MPTDKLADLAEAQREAYLAAEPFPHIVIDNLLDPAMLDELLAVFPDQDASFWQRFRSDRETKLALDKESLVPMPIRLLLYA